MDDKGQISAEYLLLIVVVLIIISSVTIPLIGKSIDASNDVSAVADSRTTVNEIANAVNIVYANGPGAKRTLDVYIPKSNTTFMSGVNYVSLTVNLSNGTKITNATTEYPLNNVTSTLSKRWYKVTVQWTDPSYISVSLT